VRQLIAILIDAYRDLNSRMLFWITLAISGSVIMLLAMFGVDSEGLSFLHFHWHLAYLDPHLFYRAIFLSLIVIGIWLSWGAVILALISTAGLFPDLLASGAIDLYLSKPISRPRLFIYKYFSGLLFVTLQLTLFSVGCFLVVGLRTHEWLPILLLALPFILSLFSYIYAFCVLIGIWSRSTIAALLLTVLLWLAFSGLQRTEGILLFSRVGLERTIHRVERDLQAAEADAKLPSRNILDLQPGLARKRAESDRDQLVDLRGTYSWIAMFENICRRIENVCPKTWETTNLLDRYLLPNEDTGADNDQPPAGPGFLGIDARDLRPAGIEVQQRQRARPLSFVIGSSLACEAVVLLLAGWLFCRRDY